MNVPTIAGAMPPPDWPNVAGPFVKKSQLSALTPRLNTDQTRMPSAAIAIAAAAIAASSATRLSRRRRRDRPVARSETASSAGSVIHPSAAARTA